VAGHPERQTRGAAPAAARGRTTAPTPRETAAIARAIISEAVDGIVTIDAHGRIRSFNPAAERMFGYAAEEVIGQNVRLLMPAPYHDDHDAFIRRYVRTGEARVIGVGREVTGLRKDGTPLDLELALSEIHHGRRRLFTAILRDVHERKQAATRLELQYAVTRVLAGTPPLGEVGPTLLRAICEAIGWAYGELWYLEPAGLELQQGAVWHLPSMDASAFVAAGRERTFTHGEGMPGQVWATGQATWIADITLTPEFLRAEPAIRAGLRSAVGVPIRTAENIAGVMVFLGQRAGEPEPRWLQTLDVLGRLIGDFVERQRAHEAVQHSELRFRNIISQSPDAMVILDPHGAVRFVNPAAERLLGRPGPSLGGEPFGLPLVRGESAVVEVPQRGAPPVIAEMRVVEFEWLGEPLHLASLRDITDRTLMEERLRATENRFTQFMQHLPGVAFMKDPDGHYVYLNTALERMFRQRGHTEYVGKTDADLWPPAVAQQLRENDERVLQSRSTVHTTEMIPQPDGTHQWLATKFPILGPDGTPVMLAGVAIDVTDRRQAEDQLAELRKQTQQRERLADIGAITAQLVHDLGNPLAGVSMQAQLILRRATRDGTQPLSSVVRPIESILTEVRRLDSLTKEFLEFSREQRLNLRKVDLVRFLQRSVDLWQPVAAARQITLSLKVASHTPALTADEEKLHRVLDNVIRNAIEAIEQGPGHVRIHAGELAPDRVRISVEDTGPGIPDTVQVFRLFETTKRDGTGIGLAVARQIVLAHRGSIDFARLDPHGTVFHVELPRHGPLGP